MNVHVPVTVQVRTGEVGDARLGSDHLHGTEGAVAVCVRHHHDGIVLQREDQVQVAVQVHISAADLGSRVPAVDGLSRPQAEHAQVAVPTYATVHFLGTYQVRSTITVHIHRMGGDLGGHQQLRC